LCDEDNINGLSPELNITGGLYAVSAGKGVCHDEHSVTEGKHEVF